MWYCPSYGINREISALGVSPSGWASSMLMTLMIRSSSLLIFSPAWGSRTWRYARFFIAVSDNMLNQPHFMPLTDRGLAVYEDCEDDYKDKEHC